MGINDEYSRDAYDYQIAYDSDDSADSEPEPLHPEDYQDWYSEQLLDAWMTIREHADQYYMNIPVGFPKFVDFVMNPSPFYTEDPPSVEIILIWEAIKNIQVIHENITRENFTDWMNTFIVNG
jgi:hypothetical protein